MHLIFQDDMNKQNLNDPDPDNFFGERISNHHVIYHMGHTGTPNGPGGGFSIAVHEENLLFTSNSIRDAVETPSVGLQAPGMNSCSPRRALL